MDQKKHTKIEAIATYNSGRQERIYSDLKKDQTPTQKFQKQLKAFKSFPTIKNVEIIRT